VPAQKTPEQLVQALARQLDLVMLSRERIQQTLDEAAERGRVTRTDANLLVTELVRRGRTQTDDLVKELEGLIDRGREGIEIATRKARRTEPVDRVVRQADKARRVVGVAGEPPITGYDDLTATKVRARLGDLSPDELRHVRDYERHHANRKTVLEAIARALA
jgi:polyhydroxyalkanoate synthesis regulator phasin